MTIINNNQTTLVISGPRAFKLFGKKYTEEDYSKMKAKRIVNIIITYLQCFSDINKVYIGMATGIDLLAGAAVLLYNRRAGKDVELICCIPGSDQTKHFLPYEKKLYDMILKQATDVVILSQLSCQENPGLFIRRNIYMIDRSNILLAFWDRTRVRSGTFQAMTYAFEKDKPANMVDLKTFNLQTVTSQILNPTKQKSKNHILLRDKENK